jgi:ABC-type nitrate/sulfonate/bicarbonate transport system substrate-binding protein
LSALEKPNLTLGFIPLTDCAPLVVAHEKGFFQARGLNVTLSKETSWANIRDKLAIGVLDGAQMLAPMVVASHLGLGPIERPVVTALSLDLNGNAITLSESLYQQLCEIDPEGMQEQPVTARPLKKLIEQRASQGKPQLTFATVFPFSSHNYLLRYWMASSGIDPDQDIRLVIIPPPQMTSQLEKGEVDGYCVGEPWSAMAVREGIGRVLITGYEIWNNSPEKVLGVNQEWAEQYPNTHLALVTALLEAVQWIDQPENRLEVVEMISSSVYVNAPAETIRMSMMGTFQYSKNEFPKSCPDFSVFHHYAANFPWYSQAMWFITQMIRWGQTDGPVDIHAIARAAYQPDIYRKAAEHLSVNAPLQDFKKEGTHQEMWMVEGRLGPIEMGSDLLLDGHTFDPSKPVDSLEQFGISHPAFDLDELRTMNSPWDKAMAEQLIADGIDPGQLADLRGK